MTVTRVIGHFVSGSCCGTSLKRRCYAGCAGAGKGRPQAAERPSAFSGDLSLDGLRVNQLKLSRNLTGSILLSNEQFQIRAKVTELTRSALCICRGTSRLLKT